MRGCVDCGYKDRPEALQFDHVRGEKECNVGLLKMGDWDRLLAEIEKCDVRCSVCHAKRHGGSRGA